MELIKSLVDEQIVRDKVELRAYESFLKDLQEQIGSVSQYHDYLKKQRMRIYSLQSIIKKRIDLEVAEAAATRENIERDLAEIISSNRAVA